MLNRRTDMCINQFESTHQECLDARAAAAAQETSDHRMAVKLDKELNLP